MRSHVLPAILLLSLSVFASTTKPILVSHNDIKGPLLNQAHTEDLTIFSDGRVSYQEAGNDRTSATFKIRLTPQQLRRLTALIDGKEIKAVPAEIPSQIRTIDYNWEKKMELYHNGSQQTVVIRNFYPLLNSHRPAYPKALIELECMLQDIQRRAAGRPVPGGDENWCPEALGKTR
jgi:hypothetical protein